MGSLHEGHLALVRAGRALCRRTIVTIFVNPRQFGPQEDFARYPRDEPGDLAKLAVAGADAVYIPPIEEMYPHGFATSVTVAGLGDELCGRFRPGHFTGVATVVTKLLLQALPDVALFGEKDYQQLRIIMRLVQDLDIPVRVVGVPTAREADGLALSSRNQYLSPEARRAAPMLYRVLSRIARQFAAGTAPEGLLAEGRAELERAGFGPVQYLEIRDADTLEPVSRADRPARVFAAAYLGRTRLIDNVPVEAAGRS
jgi:pantoate--beta-alanine ligase